MWLAINMCMEVMLGISLYSYLYLKLTKMVCPYYLFNKIGEQECKTGPGQKCVGLGGSDTNNVYSCE
jgi:hypothetical protein